MDDPSLHVDYRMLQKANSKLSLLKELLEIELEGEPVVIYTHLESSVTAICKAIAEYNPVRITGKEADEARAQARKNFMGGKSNIMVITDAGGEALNLQRARHLIFYSRPLDPGRYVQVVGRIRRFGLESTHVLLWHLTMTDSVDEWVDALLVDKFGPFDVIVKGRSGMMPASASLPMELVKIARRKRMRGESS
jgi:superfamily II DNA/RNA helicase